ncbi:MAG: HNH/ENDO VII family nuclease [Acutalibacteraceae bacterium]
MKRLIALILVLTLLTGCSSQTITTSNSSSDTVSISSAPEQSSDLQIKDESVPEFKSLNDENLLTYLKDEVYTELVDKLDSEDYFVENVDAVYISKEYLEEIEYNSQENIYFGYTLSSLDKCFQGKRYVFTLGDNGQTAVTEFQEYDDTYDKVLKNVLIGSGVILLCVTVSVVSGGLGAPAAVSMIFATSAKTGAAMALSSGILSGVSAGITTGIETGDFNEALKAAALAGSEDFKWGAISGAIAGGATKAVALKGATLNGLTMNEAATIQKQSKYPLDVIKQFHSMDEYAIYKNAGLRSHMVSGKLALVRDIDLNATSDLAGKTVTNLERMKKGYPPIDPATGKSYQLHHIGQKSDATLAILTEDEHLKNPSILNIPGKESEIDRPAFEKIKRQFWRDYATLFS